MCIYQSFGDNSPQLEDSENESQSTEVEKTIQEVKVRDLIDLSNDWNMEDLNGGLYFGGY